jgi:hypothetical protein
MSTVDDEEALQQPKEQKQATPDRLFQYNLGQALNPAGTGD